VVSVSCDEVSQLPTTCILTDLHAAAQRLCNPPPCIPPIMVAIRVGVVPAVHQSSQVGVCVEAVDGEDRVVCLAEIAKGAEGEGVQLKKRTVRGGGGGGQ
jgi:hypothetical protein